MNHLAKPLFAVFNLFLCIQTVKAQNTNFEKLDNGIIIYISNHERNSTRAVQLEVVTDKIIHAIKSPQLPLQADTSLMILKNELKTKFSVVKTSDNITLLTGLIKAVVSLKSGLISFTDLNGNKLLKEDNNVKNFKPVSIDAGRSWEVQQSFSTAIDEAFYGLGQHQQGLMNYKGNVVTLLQNNTEVAIPFLVSNKNYGILWDNYSITKFTDGRSYEPLSHLKLFDKYTNEAKNLMENKNHDYGEAWREMRVSSLTDLILMKLLRIKQIEDNKGKTIISEGVDANFYDMINYAVFALIKLSEL